LCVASEAGTTSLDSAGVDTATLDTMLPTIVPTPLPR
jgi:hypothetical protein